MIREVSQTLLRLIEAATPDLGSWVEVNSLSAADSAPMTGHLALALYAVGEHPHLGNRSILQTAGGQVRATPALRLQYLVVYMGDHDEAQARLARVVGVFHGTPIVGRDRLPDALGAEVATITIRLVTTSADERHHVWAALGRPARLALFYDVDLTPVDALRPLNA